MLYYSYKQERDNKSVKILTGMAKKRASYREIGRRRAEGYMESWIKNIDLEPLVRIGNIALLKINNMNPCT